MVTSVSNLFFVIEFDTQTLEVFRSTFLQQQLLRKNGDDEKWMVDETIIPTCMQQHHMRYQTVGGSKKFFVLTTHRMFFVKTPSETIVFKTLFNILAKFPNQTHPSTYQLKCSPSSTAIFDDSASLLHLRPFV